MVEATLCRTIHANGTPDGFKPGSRMGVSREAENSFAPEVPSASAWSEAFLFSADDMSEKWSDRID